MLNNYLNDYFLHYGESDHLDYEAFLKLWTISFTDVKLRVKKGTTGKCWTCSWINEGRRHTATVTVKRKRIKSYIICIAVVYLNEAICNMKIEHFIDK